MKLHHLFPLLAVSGLLCFPVAAQEPQFTNSPATNVVATNAIAPPLVVSREPNSRIWGRVTPIFTNDVGQILYRTNQTVTELNAGLHFWSNGVLAESSSAISITPEGAAGTNAAVKIYLPANINSDSIRLVTADNQNLRFRTMGLSFATPTTNVLIAMLQDSIGTLVSSNQVVYSNCFAGSFKADLRFTFTAQASAIEADVLIRERVTPQSWGLSGPVTLQIWTEAVDAPEATITEHPGGNEERIRIGEARFGPGRAFFLGEEENPTPVRKRWVVNPLNGRTLLLEEIDYDSISARMQSLPPSSGSVTNGGSGIGGQAGLYPGFPRRLPPTPKLAQRPGETIKIALGQADPLPALVADYILMSGAAATNYTFLSGETYYIPNGLSMIGTTTIQPGTVIKYADSTLYWGLDLYGPLVCPTNALRPAIFTSKNDDSIGSQISGSSGSPTTATYTYFFYLDDTNVNGFANCRFAYANYGALILYSAELELQNCQFYHCAYGLVNRGSHNINLRNVLFAGGTRAVHFWQNAITLKAEQVTSTSSTFWGYTDYKPVLNLTNSIILGYTSPDVESTNWAIINPGGTVFQSAAGGSYYLATNSYRGNGTTGISATTKALIAVGTTYPPTLLTNDITTDTLLTPIVPRNSSTPDYGYHYSPLDYVVTNVTVGDGASSTTLTLAGGVAVGVTGDYGLQVGQAGHVVSIGAATNLNQLAWTAAVQEHGTMPGSFFKIPALSVEYGSDLPTVDLKFTGISGLGIPGPLLNSDTDPEDSYYNEQGFGRWTMVNCQLAAINFTSHPAHVRESFLGLTNNVLERCILELGAYYWWGNSGNALAGEWRNNLFWHGDLTLVSDSTSPGWTIADNVFDNVTVGSVYLAASTVPQNGFVNMTDPFDDAGGLHVSSFNYASGPLGPWYHSSADFHDVGSAYADAVGLYHFTTATNQVKEANSPVDLGFHYPVVDATGRLKDSDRDGIPDIDEDLNGNGLVDGGETSWPYISSITLSGGNVSYTVGASPKVIDGSATVTDTNCVNLSDGTLTVSIVTNRQGEDFVMVNNQGTGAGQINVTNTTIKYGSTNIATFTGGAGTNDLVIALNTNATVAAVQALVRNVAFGYYPTNTSATSTRTVKMVMLDCNSELSAPAYRSVTLSCPDALDVTLVMDLSGSMLDSLPGTGTNKIAVARLAAQTFLNSLTPPSDKVGLIKFWDSATLVNGLTTNILLVQSNIANLNAITNGQTAISNGIAKAQTELTAHGRTNALPLIVLLTDGVPTVPPLNSNGAAISAANAAKALGTRLITIGLGSTNDFNPDLLRYLASTTNDYHNATDYAALSNAYHFIALSLCRTTSSNQSLTVNYTYPTNNQVFVFSPTNILLQATALGDVSRVQFFTNAIGVGTMLGESTNVPFEFLWTNAMPGIYNLYVRATNSSNNTATGFVTNIVINSMPTVAITNLTNIQTFLISSVSGTTNVILMAHATDSNSVTKVEFFTNGMHSAGTVTTSGTNVNCSITLNNLPIGTYPVLAQATDDSGAVVSSQIKIFRIAPTNPYPVVSIAFPTNGSVLRAGTNLTITADAHAASGGAAVTNVEFFVDGRKLGSDFLSPYSVTECCWKPGTYVLTAMATDAVGLKTLSTNVTITVADDAPTGGGFWDKEFGLHTFSLTGPGASSSALGLDENGTVYNATIEATVSGFARSTDSTNWQYMAPNPMAWRVIMADGNDVYAGGAPGDGVSHSVFKLNGTNWDGVGNELFYGDWPTANSFLSVECMQMVGKQLHIGGTFVAAGTNSNVQYIARLNTNNTWMPVGSGLNGPVYAMAQFQGELYIGGAFTNVDGNTNANYIARLAGTNWTNVGSGVLGPNRSGIVTSLAPCGTNLFVGGYFTKAGEYTNAHGVAYWNGTYWRLLDGGVQASPNEAYPVYTYSTNEFNADGLPYEPLRDFGTTPFPFDPTLPFPRVYSLVVRANRVYVGGSFTEVLNGTNTFSGYGSATAVWSETEQMWTWSDLDRGTWDQTGSTNFDVRRLAIKEGPNPSSYDLYASGTFAYVGGVGAQLPSHSIARWRIGVPNPDDREIKIIAPSPFAVFTNSPSLTVTITATDSNTSVNLLNVHANGSILNTNSGIFSSSGVFTFNWANPPVGYFSLTAEESGSPTNRSHPVSIIVVDPTNSIFAVEDAYTLLSGTPGTNLDVLANDSPTNGLRVAAAKPLRAGGGQMAVGHNGRYLFYKPSAHSYGTETFQYVVTNGSGGVGLGIVTVNVLARPTAQINSPEDGTNYPTGTTITVSGTVAGYGAPVTSVTLLTNGMPYTNITGANLTSFNLTWSTNVPGWYSLVAVATDTNGLTGRSDPVTIGLTNGAAFTVDAVISNLASSTNGLVTEYPVVRDGFFTLTGKARVNDSTNNSTLAYRVMLYRPEDNDVIGVPTAVPFRNVTPAPINVAGFPAGFHQGGDSNGLLRTLDFSGVPNGTYDLELLVRADGKESNVIQRFMLESDLKVGQFSFSEQDAAIPVSGIPLTVVRTYNSMNSRAGDFGVGWTYALNSMDIQLDEERTTEFRVGSDDVPFADTEEDAFGRPRLVSIRNGGGRNVTLTLPDGKRVTFRFTPRPYPDDPSGMAYQALWTPPPGVHAKLTMDGLDAIFVLFGGVYVWQAGGIEAGYEEFDVPAWTLTTQDGTEYHITREQHGGVIYMKNDVPFHVTPCGPPKLTQIKTRTQDRIEISDTTIQHFNAIATNTPTRSMYFERDREGRITAMRDPNAGSDGLATIKYIYNQETGNLILVQRLVDRSAASYVTTKYRYDNPNYPHYITAVEDPRGITLARNEYDDNGLLIAVVDADGNRTAFSHDSGHQLEVVTDRLAQTTSYEYDPHGNVTAVTNSLLEVTRYEYDDLNNKTKNITGYINTNAAFVILQTSQFTFDERGFQTSTVDPVNRTNLFGYDDFGNLLLQIDPLGNVVSNRYDSAGNLTNTVQLNAAGVVLAQSSSIFQNGRLAETRNATNGVTATFAYDASGNLTNTTDAKGIAHAFNYDDNGNQTNTSYTWVGGGVTNIVSTSTEFDAQNRVVRTVDPNTNQALTFYNPIGKVDYSIDRLGNTNRFLYDARGNLIRTIHADGLLTKTVYDEAGRVYISTDRNGITGTKTVYDDAGRVLSTIRLHNVWIDIIQTGETAYSVVTTNGTPVSTNSTAYLPKGWVKSRIAPGQTNSYGYWEDGQLKLVTNALGKVTSYEYDAAGRQKKVTDALNHANQFEYDGAGRMIKTIFANNSFVSNTFNNLGHRTVVTDQAQQSTTNTYDQSGQLTRVSKPQVPDPENSNTSTSPSWYYSYDSYDRLTVTTDPKGRTTTNTYDAQGRPITRRLPLGQTETNVYNAKGQLWKTFDFKTQRTEFVYDRFGRMRAKFLFAGVTNLTPSNAVCYQYNQLGQLWKVVQRHGSDATTNACDGYLALVGPSGGTDLLPASPPLLASIPVPARAVAFLLALIAAAMVLIPRQKLLLFMRQLRAEWDAWDIDYRPAKRVWLPSRGWKYVTLAIIVALFVSDPKLDALFSARADCVYPSNPSDETTRVTEFAYDNDGHLTQANTPEGVINYDYDLATGRHTSTCTSNSEVAYGYDALSRLKNVTVIKRNGTVLTNSPPEMTEYTYDDVGNRSTVTLPNGIITTYVYDSLNRLTDITHEKSSTNLATYHYVLDPTGRRTNITEIIRQDGTNGPLTNTLSYSFDGMYRLTNELSSSSSSAGNFTNRYSYDLVGNRLSKTHIFGSVTETADGTFDANDRLLSEVLKHNGSSTDMNNYGYDSNGSLIAKTNGTGTVTFTYGLFNKLSSVTTTNGTSSYYYNESGIRVRSTEGGGTKYYLVDANNHTGYAQIIEEKNVVGVTPTLATSYVIGDDVLGQCGTTPTAAQYLLYDGHGSTRQMSSLNGEVTRHYHYDAYGQQITGSSSGSVETSLLYCGEQFDSGLQMYNLRARFYDPSIGRFDKRDPYAGDTSEPQSLHKYSYAYGNPINYSDPSGMLTLTEQLLVVTVGLWVGVAAGIIVAKNIIHTPKGPPSAFVFGVTGQAFLFAGIDVSLEVVHVFSTGETKSPYFSAGLSMGLLASLQLGITFGWMWNMTRADDYLGPTSTFEVDVSLPNGLTLGVAGFAAITGSVTGVRFFIGYGKNVSGVELFSFASVSGTYSLTWLLPTPLTRLNNWVKNTLAPALVRPNDRAQALSADGVSGFTIGLERALETMPQNQQEGNDL